MASAGDTTTGEGASGSGPRVLVPEELRGFVRERAGEAADAILEALGEVLPGTGEDFSGLERRLAAIADRKLAAPGVGKVVDVMGRDRGFVGYAVEQAQAVRSLKVHSNREVKIELLDGGEATVNSAYATPPPPPSDRPGRRRAVGKRGPTGNGAYPVLGQLGFMGRRSPALASDIARAAAELASFEEAEWSLNTRGIDVDDKTVRGIAYRFADAGLEARLAEDAETEQLKGKRVVVAFDGGRVRTRVSGKRLRRREATGARGFDAPWREPQLLAIYTVDEKGRKTAERPWYEATMSGWDDIFRIAAKLLRHLGAKHAAGLVVCGDGHRNIWDRVEPLLVSIDVDRSRVELFCDFWHAVEYLTKAAELVVAWTPEQRTRWRRACRRVLYDGRVDDVISRILALPVPRKHKSDLEDKADYFRKRTHLMRYDKLRAAHLPIGSGAIESAVRRVLNLRLKGPGIFWEELNADRMLLLRCRLKSGRWDELEHAVARRATATHGRVLAQERKLRSAG